MAGEELENGVSKADLGEGRFPKIFRCTSHSTPSYCSTKSNCWRRGYENDNLDNDESNDGSTPVADNDDDKGTDDKSTDKGGKKLPNTATNMYNYLLAGVLLLLVGAGSLFFIQKR